MDNDADVGDVESRPSVPETVKCPWCAEEILAAAKKCKHCGEFLTDDTPSSVSVNEPLKVPDAFATISQATQLASQGDELLEQAKATLAGINVRADHLRTQGNRLGDEAKTALAQDDEPRSRDALTRREAIAAELKVLEKQHAVVQAQLQKLEASETRLRSVTKPNEGSEKRGFKAAFSKGAAQAKSNKTTGYTGKGGSREQISAVGAKTDAGLACPKCGGTQFTAKRSKKGKVIGFTTLGVGGLVAPKSQVKCVTCGTMFKRG